MRKLAFLILLIFALLISCHRPDLPVVTSEETACMPIVSGVRWQEGYRSAAEAYERATARSTCPLVKDVHLFVLERSDDPLCPEVEGCIFDMGHHRLVNERWYFLELESKRYKRDYIIYHEVLHMFLFQQGIDNKNDRHHSWMQVRGLL